MEQKIYGYIRVSTKEQNEDRQRIAMVEMQIPDKMIYMDTASARTRKNEHHQENDRRTLPAAVFDCL